jgi:hypothetical protein
MDAVQIKIGYVVMKHGDPVRTRAAWGHNVAKVYQKIGTAKAVATQKGAVVFPAYIVVGDEVK